MSTSGMLCSACGTRLATVKKSGRIHVLPGIDVTVIATGVLLGCPCGYERMVRSPTARAA